MSSAKPQILILANKLDFASDYVAARLCQRGVPYLRLNNEDLPSLALNFFPSKQKLYVLAANSEFEINSKNLKSVFFRRPIFLREGLASSSFPSEQLSQSQSSV